MRNPGQSRVWTSAVKKTISALSIVLNCCLVGAVIFLGVTVMNLKLSMNQLEENTETTIADLSNVIERVQKTLRVAEGISGAPGKRLTNSNLSGTLETEHQILQRLEKLEAGVKKQQDESEEVHAATDRPVSFCPNGYQKYREVCYKAYDTRKKFYESGAACRADGGTLAMPRDSGINAFLVSLIQAVDSYSNFWFGLHDQREDGKWEWIDGTELDGNDFNMWSEGRQSSKNWTEVQNCVLYWWIDQYSWNDSGCLSIMKFICQIVPSGSYYKVKL
ncbi:PREDICTED: C-type lectin domain family 3 member A-like isoform X1 [Branchiostoma belcheri]|uniref:C-type lectin domain family 3 member A-like isoform X1 n=1 Tax=Branchiostoma belcheri TaxID=7741 RepID=A0A6P5A0M7_BRABE|nr:PREDICTED: C-type lectin domain family 3 member A-like isoform X1 [Branchiostoma belcheri]